MICTDQPQIDSNADDRRRDRRYRIPLELRWRLLHRRKVQAEGVGRTIDLSSGGILFDANRHLPPGMNVEVSVSWPVRQNGVAAMQLVVSGRIVRSNESQVAIRETEHQFRTVRDTR
ncbi:MAG: PilZ domain-containing protein [Acidobacteriia bacterium]|nr:PilZ domain-containing protein [Terriglobia bacterium]